VAEEPEPGPGAPEKARPAASTGRNVALSVVAGVLLAVVVVGTLLAGAAAFFVLALAVVLIAQLELYGVLRSSGESPAALVGLVCGAVLLCGTYLRGPLALALLIALPLPLLCVWALTVPKAKERSTIASTYLGVAYAPLLGAFMVLLLRGPHGRVIVPAFIGMASLQDSGAYLIGRKIGRHRMTPRTSPAKTWEGLVAGTVVSVALSCAILPFLRPFDVWLAFRLALVMCAVAPFGDLAESLVKRDLGVKDMGSLMPGHGGLFDRIDAALFCAPAAYFVLHTLGWAS
jgi:phosphatidate cytidylyltransferase